MANSQSKIRAAKTEARQKCDELGHTMNSWRASQNDGKRFVAESQCYSCNMKAIVTVDVESVSWEMTGDATTKKCAAPPFAFEKQASKPATPLQAASVYVCPHFETFETVTRVNLGWSPNELLRIACRLAIPRDSELERKVHRRVNSKLEITFIRGSMSDDDAGPLDVCASLNLTADLLLALSRFHPAALEDVLRRLRGSDRVTEEETLDVLRAKVAAAMKVFNFKYEEPPFNEEPAKE